MSDERGLGIAGATASPQPALVPTASNPQAVLTKGFDQAHDPSDCESCDGFGCIWNNADPTSGQWIACECGDTRGRS